MDTRLSRFLVAYDGSEPAETALGIGVAVAKAGVGLDILTVVDESVAITESSSAGGMIDPTPLIEALDAQGDATAKAAAARASAAGVAAHVEVTHEQPIPGVLSVAERLGDDAIVLGTHARSGLARTFLGSITEGVLRSGSLPIVVVQVGTIVPSGRPFGTALVAVDDSEPSDAAVAFTRRLTATFGTVPVLCSIVDTRDTMSMAGAYGYDPMPFVEELRVHANEVLTRANERAGGAAEMAVVEGEAAETIVAEAVRRKADCIVMGSHGRRGLRRLFLGSVAENVLRHSPIPVIVVRVQADGKAAG